MAFNKENKVTIKELAPSLIELLNSKVSKTDFNAHVNNADLHITPADRAKWNSTLDAAKEYADNKLATAMGPLNDSLNQVGGNLTAVINSKVDKSIFDAFKSTLNRVAFTGSYNDLKDLPSGIASSDMANRALRADTATNAINAEHAKEADHTPRADLADNATRVGGIRITVGSAYPDRPENDKDIFYHTGDLMLYVYTNNKWQMTGAALRL